MQRGKLALFSRESWSASAFDGFLTSQESLRVLRMKLGKGSRVLVSPSLLEVYMRCGFRFLAEHCLDLEKESWTPELDSRELGDLLHRVLHRFMKGLEPPGRSDAANWNRLAAARLQGLLEVELGSWPLRETRKESLSWTMQEEFLRAGLNPGDARRGVFSDFLIHQSRWLRHHQVEALGKKLNALSLGNVTVGSGRAEILLTGTVDRVDRSSRGLVVIDYKGGTIPLGRLYRGWGFQLPLYYLLAGNHYQEEVESAFFFHIEPPFRARPRTVRLPDNDNRGWTVLAESYRDLALEATRAILSGKFPVTLVGTSQAGCRECNFRDVCRMDSAKAARLRDSGHLPIARPVLKGGKWAASPEIPEQGGAVPEFVGASSQRELNQAQKAALDLSSNIALTAAAGSGKTTVLIERFLHIMRDNEYRPEEVVAITFTEEAARQMRERVREEIEGRVEAEEPGGSSLWRRALTHLPRSPITTIHGFCHSLLREYFWGIGLDPDFELLDPSRQQLLAAGAVSQTLQDGFLQQRSSLRKLLHYLPHSSLEGLFRQMLGRRHHLSLEDKLDEEWLKDLYPA